LAIVLASSQVMPLAMDAAPSSAQFLSTLDFVGGHRNLPASSADGLPAIRTEEEAAERTGALIAPTLCSPTHRAMSRAGSDLNPSPPEFSSHSPTSALKLIEVVSACSPVRAQ
jgi:hypothetical protein